jgi:hypothetical protein
MHYSRIPHLPLQKRRCSIQLEYEVSSKTSSAKMVGKVPIAKGTMEGITSNVKGTKNMPDIQGQSH